MSNPIKYSDFIQPDDSIKSLIEQLQEVQETYAEMLSKIKSDGESLRSVLYKIRLESVQTAQTRKVIADSQADIDKLTKAQKELTFAQSDNAIQLAKLKQAAADQNAENKNIINLDKQIITSTNYKTMSYKQLSAQYSLNKKELNALNAEQRNSSGGQALIESTKNIYEQMKVLQQETGNTTLEVGSYDKVMKKYANATKKYFKNLVKGGWVGAIMMAIKMINKLISIGDDLLKSLVPAYAAWSAAVKDNNKIIKDASTAVGPLMATYEGMRLEWGRLGDDINAKNKYIRDHAEQFDKLGIEIYGVKDAEKALTGNTDSFVNAMITRAKAAAMAKIAEEKYKKALEEQLKQEEIEKYRSSGGKKGDLGFFDTFKEKARGVVSKVNKYTGGALEIWGDVAHTKEQSTALSKDKSSKLINRGNELMKRSQELAMSAGPKATNKKRRDAGDKASKSAAAQAKKDAADEKRRLAKEAADEKKRLKDEEKHLKDEEAQKGKDSREKMSAFEEQQRLDKAVFEIEKHTDEEKKVFTLNQEREKYQMMLDLNKEYNGKLTEQNKTSIQQLIDGTEKKIEDVKAEAAAKTAKESAKADLKVFTDRQKLQKEEFDAVIHTEAQKKIFAIDQEKELLQKKLELNQIYNQQLSDETQESMQSTIDKLTKKAADIKAKARKPKDIYEMLGIIDPEDPKGAKKKEAIGQTSKYIMGQLNDLASHQEKIAKDKVDKAHKETEAARQDLANEIAMKAQGYASDVEGAKAALAEKEKQEKKANKALKVAAIEREAINTVEQASNLAVAVTKLYAEYPFPISLAFVAPMVASFVASRLLAFKAVKKMEKGGVELLEGGSHASGNDISLGYDGHNEIRAEGGEYFGVVNKSSSKKYGTLVPEIINSLNDKTFEKRFMDQYKGINMMNNIISFPTDEVKEIRDGINVMKDKQTIYIDNQGRKVIVNKGLTMTITQ